MFAKIQSKLTKGLEITLATSTAAMIPCVARGYWKDVEFLWDLVHVEAVTKVWTVFDEDSEFKTRTHSATLFRSLEEYCAFILNDHRLLYQCDPEKKIGRCVPPMEKA